MIRLGRKSNIRQEETRAQNSVWDFKRQHLVWGFIETGSTLWSEDSVGVRTSGWLLCFSDLSTFILISDSGISLLRTIRICATGLLSFFAWCNLCRWLWAYRSLLSSQIPHPSDFPHRLTVTWPLPPTSSTFQTLILIDINYLHL